MARGKKTGGKDFRPGVSGNPAGRPPLPEDIRAARKLNSLEFERIINELLYLTPQDLDARLTLPSTTALEKLVGKIIQTALQDGAVCRVEFLLSRTIGRAVKSATDDPPRPTETVDPAEAKAAIRKLVRDLKETDDESDE